MSDMQMIVRTEAENYKPVLSIGEVLERQDMIRQYAAAVMHEGEDYGVIPGTGTRKVLLKPGAEKLVRIFGLTPRFSDVKIEEDWTGADHGGEMFFAYTIKCSLYRNEVFMGDADGSCNSWEKKYRYISQERTCPNCGKSTVRANTLKKINDPKFKPSYYCWAKVGGCGSQFYEGTEQFNALHSQQPGKIPDPDIADKVNTIRKMAEKRALVAACLIVVGASEFFTQDIEPDRPAPPPQEERTLPRDQGRTMGYTRPAAPQRQEEAYEAEYVSQEPTPVETITRVEASKKLKAALDDRGYAPPDAEAYKRIMRLLENDKAPEAWTAQDFLNASKLPQEILDDAIKAMQVHPDVFKSPAATIKESLPHVA